MSIFHILFSVLEEHNLIVYKINNLIVYKICLHSEIILLKETANNLIASKINNLIAYKI